MLQDIDSALGTGARPAVSGKFLAAGGERLYLCGVTYGAFAPDADGREYTDAVAMDRDFALMTAAGINAVRIPHTIPSRRLLDIAAQYGLRVMVNLEGEQQIGHISDGRSVSGIARRIERQVSLCAGHPALLGYTLGNEIPAQVVRWLGHSRVERYLERLYFAAKDKDPEGLVSYANYPSTEYLEFPFLDLVCFNVYLEGETSLADYLARLQNLAGDRPLVVTELGLDARRNGELAQARALEWMVGKSFAAGCAGTFVFAWTDEWHRAGEAVDDWAFGVTARNRCPKPALAALQRAYGQVPFPRAASWPRVSIVVCSHNGASRIRECLAGIAALDYPDFEVIVVDDGSHDDTGTIAREFPVRLIRTDHCGLSHARNVGLQAAQGEIVSYLDDDSHPDPGWLKYLVATLTSTSHAGVGGPNIAPSGDGLIADCVASSPGGPTHVLLSDREAEHIPGCNMAFRTDALRAIGGFDLQFRIAGDDVDVCWRLQQRGWTLGFSPAAVVWHHCRDSVWAYWRQQRQYGRAEALLERKWPEKYTRSGHLMWAGRLYGSGLVSALARPARVYHGTWGMAPFQFRSRDETHPLRMLPAMPEWYLILVILLGLTLFGVFWRPLLVAAPILAATIAISCLQAFNSARQASCLHGPRPRRVVRRVVTACLYLTQPLARLVGRVGAGLTPLRRHSKSGFALPWRRTVKLWADRRQEPERWLQSLEAGLLAEGVSVSRGGEYDRWDIEARAGLLGTVRILAAVEEHGANCQLLRVRVWPLWPRAAVLITATCAALAFAAGVDRAWIAAAMLAGPAVLLTLRILEEAASVMAAVLRALAGRLPETAPAGRTPASFLRPARRAASVEPT